MTKKRSQHWSFVVLAAAAIALVSDGVLRGFGSDPSSGALAVLAALGIGAALYRPQGRPSLAMGACALPLAIEISGALGAALLAVLILVGRQSILWIMRLEEEQAESGKSQAIELLQSLGPAAIAVLVAGWLGAGLPGVATRLGTEPPAHLARLTDFGALAGLGQLALAGAAFLTLFIGLTLLTGVGSSPSPGQRDPTSRSLRPFLLDGLGWAAGLVLALVVATLGWPSGLILGAALVFLSGAALAANLRAWRERKISNRLREVHLAGHRIIFHQPDILAIADRIRSECRGVVDFAWFHLELRDPDGRRRHWGAGPNDRVIEGKPEPPEAPPRGLALGRRPSWKIVRRELSTGERILGSIKLWCDPRKLREGEVQWLDNFLPQVSSAIERAVLNREARRDPLTDLPDRRVLEARLEESFHRSIAAGSPMSVIMVDLDHFKLINDRHGHAIGDQALVHVTRLLEQHRRETDVCCRYGGEEFALVLEDADGETALAVAERIRRAVEVSRFAPEGKPVPLRLSAGIASFPKLAIQNGSELIELADEALYEAKRQGRNRCVLNLGQDRFRVVSAEPFGPESGVAALGSHSALG